MTKSLQRREGQKNVSDRTEKGVATGDGRRATHAIWMLEPTAIVSERSILSLTETVTAVTCSAALLEKCEGRVSDVRDTSRLERRARGRTR